jgi:hypothetical protein
MSNADDVDPWGQLWQMPANILAEATLGVHGHEQQNTRWWQSLPESDLLRPELITELELNIR